MKIDPNYLSSLTTLVVGLFAFIIFYLNKRETLINATTLVLIEIRNIEKCFENFKINNDFLKPTPISTDNWLRYQHLISPRLDEDQRRELINLFDDATVFNQIVSEWQNIHLNSLISKTNKMQDKLIDIAHESNGNSIEYEAKKKQVTDLISNSPTLCVAGRLLDGD